MNVFITGLTGTLGTALAKLHHARGDTVTGCARNEAACSRWKEENRDIARLMTADAALCADLNSPMARRMAESSRVYHCAAMKHVDQCEQFPEQAWRQNVLLTETVANTCAALKVPMVFVSSDKACLPQGVYGASKLLGEQIALSRGAAVVRLGNLIGSSGSVFEAWKRAIDRREKLKLTDPDMTRFFISVEEAAAFIADESLPGKVVIPFPMHAVRMGEVAVALLSMTPDVALGVEIIGRRPGETQHQWLVAPGDSVDIESSRMALGVGEIWHRGLNSAAPTARWDVQHLLTVAGVVSLAKGAA